MGCDTADSTCNGGFMDDDFAFAEKNGPCTEASYSYHTTMETSCETARMNLSRPATLSMPKTWLCVMWRVVP